jgi:purine-binding chemotaxis protein CheW
MSVQKKKKLESAINNLFSTPRAKSAKSQVEELSNEPESGLPVVEENAAVLFEQSSAEQEPVETQPAQIELAMDEILEPAEMFNQPVQSPEAMSPQSISAMKATVAVLPSLLPAVAQTEPAVNPLTTGSDDQLLKEQESIQMVIFTLDGQYYGIDIASVQSIIKMQPITRLPNVPHYTIGLTNLRGKVVPVFSLRRRFGLSDQPEEKVNRIIIIRIEQEDVGLMVDGVSEVETILRANIEPAPEMALTVSTQFITGIAKLDERLIIFLNVQNVITPSN